MTPKGFLEADRAVTTVAVRCPAGTTTPLTSNLDDAPPSAVERARSAKQATSDRGGGVQPARRFVTF